MCYNIAYIEQKLEKYAERYERFQPSEKKESGVRLEIPANYFISGFSHPVLPIVKHDGIFLFEWGLIPPWVKDLKTAHEIRTKTLNAVGETVFEKPSFKRSIASQRCLLGISGFYEWRDLNNIKYPYFIHTKNKDVFSLGCIYETWVDRSTGEIRNTFSILTTPANPLMETIHNLKKRMPLILSREDEKKWVEPTLTKEQISALIKPYPETELSAYTISQSVNNARNNRNMPEILERVNYPELSF